MLDIQTSIQSLSALRRLYEDRVNQDNCQSGTNPIYLPNPIFTNAPKYGLIAMEPSLNRMTPETFQTLVNRGFHNFLYSEEDFILHYCLYHSLCHDSFDYHITDISKGAMNIVMAHLQRNQRYANWLIILKKELEFSNNRPLIAIGCRARDFLSKTGHFQLEFSVMHYSQNNSARFRDYYNQHSHKSLTGDLHIKLKEFAVRMLDDQNYNAQLKIEILSRLFNNELSIWKKGLFLKYMDEFSVTRN